MGRRPSPLSPAIVAAREKYWKHLEEREASGFPKAKLGFVSDLARELGFTRRYAVAVLRGDVRPGS